MGLFSLGIKVLTLPISVAVDVVKAPLDIATGREVGSMSKENIEQIEDEI